MKRFRRNAVSYGNIDTCIDKNGNTLKVGDYIIYNNNKQGPITKILDEFNLPINDPIKYLIYINNKVYSYQCIQVYS